MYFSDFFSHISVFYLKLKLDLYIKHSGSFTKKIIIFVISHKYLKAKQMINDDAIPNEKRLRLK